MTSVSIRNPDIFQIKDGGAVYYGFDQEWYPTRWQRLSGCGPTAVSNIMHYLLHAETGKPPYSKSEGVALMQEVWKYVTPTMRGIPATKPLYEGALAFAEAKAMNMEFRVLDIPKKPAQRPEFSRLLSFLDSTLRSNSPVAFLNLNNGTQTNLDSWHWVTIIAMEYAEDGSLAAVSFLDEGTIKMINLEQWYRTTTLGGGFVSFHLR